MRIELDNVVAYKAISGVKDIVLPLETAQYGIYNTQTCTFQHISISFEVPNTAQYIFDLAQTMYDNMNNFEVFAMLTADAVWMVEFDVLVSKTWQAELFLSLTYLTHTIRIQKA